MEEASASTSSRRSTIRPISSARAARPPRAAGAPDLAPVDVGRLAIGQDKLLVTPLQMATVAQTIANGGVRMKPHMAQRIVDPDGPHASTRSGRSAPSA